MMKTLQSMRDTEKIDLILSDEGCDNEDREEDEFDAS